MFGKKNEYDQFKSGDVVAKPAKKKSNFRIPFIAKSKFLRRVGNIFSNKDILKKIGVTLVLVFIYRALSTIPLPGVDLAIYKEIFSNVSSSEASYIFTIFTGGRLDTPSIVGLGLAAYINASIMMQLLPYVFSRLKEIQKDGERGRQVINQITRFLTVPLSFVYSIAYLLLLSQQDLSQQLSLPEGSYLIPRLAGTDWPSAAKILFMALILTAGTVFVMWLSEIITEKGLGNGSSIVISIGILSSLPSLLQRDLSQLNFQSLMSDVLQGNFGVLNTPLFLSLIGVAIGFVLVIAGIVFITESERKVSIQYARRVRGEEGGQGSFLPIKFTVTGVMPVIFAFALLSIPQLIVPIAENAGGSTPFLESVKSSFLYASNDQLLDANDFVYDVVYFVLVILFGVFYSYIVMNPQETAENLQKSGAFVPGIRPGKSTENYIGTVLLRIAFVGSMFLAVIALMPILGRGIIFQSTGQYIQLLSGIGGTSILIIVGVLLDTSRQYRSLVATRSYDKYLK